MNIWRTHFLPLAIAAAVALAGLGCEVPPGVEVEDNEAPVARLSGPQIIRVGEAATFDAAASDDVDDEALTFVFTFGDGSPQAENDDGVFEHVFAAPGRVQVAVEVIDPFEASALAAVDVTIIEGEVETCDCERPCLDDGVCASDVCHLQASSADEAAAPLPEALVCP